MHVSRFLALALAFLPALGFTAPITHTVFFRLKHADGSPEAHAFYVEAGRLAAIPGVEAFRWVKETSSKNGFEHGLSMVFAGPSAYEAYNRHPDHVRFVQEVWIPQVADFLEVDFVEDPWEHLLDGTLSQWEVWTGVPYASVADQPGGYLKALGSESAKPLGLGDPLGLFSVVKGAEGEAVLQVSGEAFAGLTTLREYSNYHLTFEVRWGEKKWPPRLDQKRDSGLLYHAHGEHGAFWKVWMSSLEYQIQEGDFGDLHQLAGPRSVTRQVDATWDPAGQPVLSGKRVIRRENHESPHGTWTRVDLYVFGDRAVHVVNGQVVLALEGAQTKDGRPLTSGKIQLQSEGAACAFRDIRLRGISGFPPEVEAQIVAPAAGVPGVAGGPRP